MRQREETSAGELEKLRREKSEVDKQCVSLHTELEETKRKLEKSEKELEASRKMMSQMEMSVQSSNVCLFWEG